MLAALALSYGCAASGGRMPTPRAQTTPAEAGEPPAAVTVEALATPTEAPPATGIIRPRPPGPLEGELLDDPPQEGLCSDPYVTPTASPEPPDEPDDPDATATPQRIAHATEVPTPAAPELPPLQKEDELERRILERLDDDASHYGVVIRDLRDGRGVSINGDQVFYAASLFKLEVMYEILHQREAGLLDLDEEYVATDYYAGFGLSQHLLAQCEPASIADALYAMMSISDNTAAVMLQDRAGAGHINNAMASLGLQETRLTEDQSLPATADDLARLLELIARGEAVSRDASQMMADLLATEKINDRIPYRLPEGTLVAHKTGNWTDATHDAGIVYSEDSAYVMVLMSDLGFDTDSWSVEADVARIAWDYFEGTEPETPEP
jgi:beta-lactamase class A